MKNKITLSVGIPAFNESKNIKYLIDSILRQNTDGFVIKEIIVASDGSTDKTAEIVQHHFKKPIILLIGAKRKGKSFRLAQIFKTFKSDILILCDADILIKDKFLFSKIIKDSDINDTKLATVNCVPTTPKNFFQRITKFGSSISFQIADSWRSGDNYLMYRGCFLVLEKKFAKSIKLSEKVINNDAYIYFFAKSKNVKPKFMANAKVYYKTPTNFLDHLRQSLRFQISKKEMRKYFNLDESYEYKIPLTIFISVLIKNSLVNPLIFLSFILVSVKTRITRGGRINQTWSIAGSTKTKII